MFQIIKQSNPNLGCIPACARSVVEGAGVPAPTEQETRRRDVSLRVRPAYTAL